VPEEPEALTRRRRVDPRLMAAGWRVVKFDERAPLQQLDRYAIAEYPTETGPADYALCVGGRILGIVEAKKLTLGPQNVLTQAERYSRGVSGSPFDFRGFRVPFLYSTNGEVIWHHDIRSKMNRSYQLSGFHTPEALEERLGRDLDEACEKLAALPNNHELIRDYQRDANTAVEQAIAGRKRQMLMAMATGTGKTFTMVNQVYRLMKSGAAKRVLFLVDRRVLAAQAVRAFASFEPEPGLKFDKIYEVYSQRFRRDDLDPDEQFDPKVLPAEYLLAPSERHAFVYVSTIQRMAINLFGRDAIFGTGDEAIDEDADKLDIPIHAFDVIVADECHRGYTREELSVWRQTLDHFDAVKIGLTATPAAHTTAYFHDIVFRYEYERAVREGHLVDYDVVAIKSEVRMNGMFLEEGAAVDKVDTTTGARQMDLLEDERTVEAPEVEKKATSPDSNRKILEQVRMVAQEHERDFGRLPKILIFADNDLPHTSHADNLVEIALDVFGRGESFVQKITGRVDRPLQRIREFRNRPEPGIVVTVDLLSTGVDIPDLEFIVFLRPVLSRILFEQMLGRGTRKGERFPDKSHFTVFDCFDGTLIEYFANATAITAEPLAREYLTIVQIIENVWGNVDREYHTRCLVKRLGRIDKEMSGEARDRFARFIPEGDLARYARELPAALRKDFTGTMKLLRDKDFQELLQNYPRPKRQFLVAYGVQDKVESTWLVRGADGRELKPGDYLKQFAEFVAANRDQIEAIRILLERPQGWSTEALVELREKLKTAAGNFTEAKLSKAHEVCYHKALVDIISMVKHAARDAEPLLTAEERVDRAFQKIAAGRKFTEEQFKWLTRIQNHLVQNLSIGKEDFEAVPVLARLGGWGRANKVFEGQLEKLLRQINEEVAA
jgi:type I restriction enzyme R subunit